MSRFKARTVIRLGLVVAVGDPLPVTYLIMTAEDMAEPARGRIITFYSYKGGVGRSMALANVAWILASNGYRVLAVDWDLEAPGLHRYFAPFLIDRDLAATDGLIDMLAAFGVMFAQPGMADSSVEEWIGDQAGLLPDYTVSIDRAFNNSGTLHVLAAGRQGAGYGLTVASFNWQNFYERLGGGIFFDALKMQMRRNYDYVLIDSRTGISDTSGICTIQMPDALVVFFTYNVQSIEGASAAANSARVQRPELLIFPVPCRVELAEHDRLIRARDYARTRFEQLLHQLTAGERNRYWSDVETLYYPFYAYEEVLAVFGDRPGVLTSLLGSYERLASALAGERVALHPVSEAERRIAFDRYASVLRHSQP